MKSRALLAAGLLAVLLITMIGAPSPSSAQLVVVDKKLIVTELRPDVGKVGVSVGKNAGETRNWVKIDGNTRISHGLRVISATEFWRVARPGMVMRVHGGRGFDNNITAKQIWL